MKASGISRTPTDEDKKSVYPLVIDNTNDEKVIIDDNNYLPINHKAADAKDGNLYVYLTGENYDIIVGSNYYKALWENNVLTLKSAQKPDTPAFDVSKTATSLSIAATNYDVGYGSIKYRSTKLRSSF